jgi:hypothetical protein
MPAPEISQHLLQAHVSMILVSLPLPPLPVLVIRGEDHTYSNLLRKWLYYIMSPELSGTYTTSAALSGWDVESPAPALARDQTNLSDLYCTPDYSPQVSDEE